MFEARGQVPPHPLFVISLDFEQGWGMEAGRARGDRAASIIGARSALPRILALAERHRIACTWATVGLLFLATREEMIAAAPAIKPSYSDPELSNYARLPGIGRDEKADPLHFGQSLIRLIQDHPRQEIACHTFSHYYALEDGEDPSAFAADLDAARAAAGGLRINLRSLVFPRNQVRPSYLALCHAAGYRSFRGTQRSRLHASQPRSAERRWARLLRAADNYLPLTGSPPINAARPVGDMLDVPASRFLRPSTGYSPLDLMQLARIRSDMSAAARNRGIFHLWWHPQNFGENIDLNLATLEAIFEHYHVLEDRFGMVSATMDEVATIVDEPVCPA